MLSLNTLRTKFGIVLSIVIGGTLLAFVLGDFLGNRSQGEIPDVGEINGEVVDGMEFRKAYDEATAFMDDNADPTGAMAINSAWQSLVYDKVYALDLEELGLSATEGEVDAVFEQNLEGNPYMQQMMQNEASANVYKKLVNRDQAMSKYVDLVRSGAYANSLMVKKSLVAENNTYKGHYVVANYSTIADSEVNVSDAEIKSYYDANFAKYKQTPYRTVTYAHFEVEPSEADEQVAETEAKSIGAAFAKATNLEKYAAEEPKVLVADGYTSADALSSDELKALRNGKMFGPEKQGDNWYASRVLSTRTAPEDFELQHIILAKTDDQLVDSLYTAAKAKDADFAAMIQKHSLYPEAQNDNISYSDLPTIFADALVKAQKGSVVMIDRGDLVFITKVLNAGDKTKHYRLVTMNYPVEASKETRDAIYNEATEFVKKAKGSVENFNNAATTVSPSSVNLRKGERSIAGLPGSLDLARWAASAKAGVVSDIMKLNDGWVVAVVSAIDNAEHKTLGAVSADIKRTLVREKKAELLKAKLQGATLEEIAKNANLEIKSFKDAKLASYYINDIGTEPRVAGVLATVTEENTGVVLPLVEGSRGVYAIVVDKVAVSEEQTADAERVKAQAREASMASYRAMQAAQEDVKVVDNTLTNF